MNEKLIVSHSPHFVDNNSIQRTMLHVIIALIPSLISGCIFFGLRAFFVTVTCVLTCVFSELIWQKFLKKPVTVNDLSAVVTGMLLAFNLPSGIPLWIAMIGSAFAIIIVKQFFGGLGQNFMNPALAARAFLLASWALAMTTFPNPGEHLRLLNTADAVTSATPLEAFTQSTKDMPSYTDLFFGNIGGCIGETSKLAILIGAVYLLLVKVIRLRIPVIYIATVALGAWIFGGRNELFTGDWLYQILSGGLFLGAFFMATDYTTTPTTPVGQILFALGCGILTVLFRFWGGYPEGVSYSILLMNILTPLIDKCTAPRPYGPSIFKREVR